MWLTRVFILQNCTSMICDSMYKDFIDKYNYKRYNFIPFIKTLKVKHGQRYR